MAASAAKYGHCQVRTPVPYRTRTPFRPEVAAPLDFALRAGELLALDRELDRAVLGVDELEALILESVFAQPGPGGLFLSDRERAAGSPSARATSAGGPGLGPRRRQFIANGLRFTEENARFRPPWTETLVQDVHAVLLGDLGLYPAAGEFRTEPYVGRTDHGLARYETCPPDRIEPELRALLAWVDRYGATLHPVVPATILVQGFRSIRPFPHGNAIVARAMAEGYLQAYGLPNVGLTPTPLAIAESPDLLDRLMLWTQATGSYTEIVDHLLDCLLRAYLAATDRWLGRAGPSGELDEVALRILSRARRSPGWFSPQEAARWVGRRSATTVRRHLNGLVRGGFLEALGRTRGKRYRLVSPVSVLPKLKERFAVPASAPALADHRVVEPPRAPDPEG